MTDPLTVTIAIPTYHRPEKLRALLAALPARVTEAQHFGESVRRQVIVQVVVIDNDPAGSARVTVMGAPLSASYAIQAVPGIAAVRNALLDHAVNSRLVAFIDDDERPLEHWLSALLATWLECGEPAAVMGRVISVFKSDLEPWVEHTGVFQRRERPTGTELAVAAAGNLLLDLHQVRDMDLRFDVSLGLAGGEDTLFTRQLVAAGGRIVWCNESRTEDSVPAHRMTRRWAMNRAFNGGNAATQVELRMTPSTVGRVGVRVRLLFGGLLRLVGGWTRHMVGRFIGNVRHQARGLRTAYRGMGMAAGTVGHHRQEYARQTSTSTAHLT